MSSGTISSLSWADEDSQIGETRHDVVTTINYYDDPGDGSAPTPVYVSK
jgi:hypothetical protein